MQIDGPLTGNTKALWWLFPSSRGRKKVARYMTRWEVSWKVLIILSWILVSLSLHFPRVIQPSTSHWAHPQGKWDRESILIITRLSTYAKAQQPLRDQLPLLHYSRSHQSLSRFGKCFSVRNSTLMRGWQSQSIHYDESLLIIQTWSPRRREFKDCSVFITPPECHD